MEVAILPAAIANAYIDSDRARGKFGDCRTFAYLRDAVCADFPTCRAAVFRLPNAPHGAPRFAILSADALSLWRDLPARCFAPGADVMKAPPLSTEAWQ